MIDSIVSQFLSLSNFQRAWYKVASNKGCAGVDRETIADFALRADDRLQCLIRDIDNWDYCPLSLRQVLIPKKDGGWRNLAIPAVRDRIAQQALLQVLQPLMERRFSDSSFAYRPGRSHHLAAQQVARWRIHGYEWVLDADIVKFFDNVGHERLQAEVAKRFSHTLVLALISSWVVTDIATHQGLILPQKGIPQGSVISPLLANIYLDDFDAIFSREDLKLVRYADDFLLLARSEQEIVEAKAEVENILRSIGLQLHPSKTQITTFEQGFRFVGNAFTGSLVIPLKPRIWVPKRRLTVNKPLLFIPGADVPIIPTQPVNAANIETINQQLIPLVSAVHGVRQRKPIVIKSLEVIWKPGMATLYLVHQGTVLRQEQGRFLVQPPKQAEVQVPIREVGRILIFGNIQMTSYAISACLEAKISVIFLTQAGEYKGHLWTGEFSDLKIQRAQFRRQDDEAFKLQTARAIVRGKLTNSRQLLLRLNRKREVPDVAESIAGIAKDISSLENADNLNSLRGYEGIASARYFSAFGKLIVNPDFSFTVRNRRPPKDPVNSLLSLGYTLLFNNVLSLLLAEGLNPYLGNLHGSDKKLLFLAFDMVEEFRSPIVDSLVLTLINQKALYLEDFIRLTLEGGIYLTEQARRLFIQKFEERMGDEVTHPDVQLKVSYRRAIQLQLQRYKQALMGSVPYEAFLRSA